MATPEPTPLQELARGFSRLPWKRMALAAVLSPVVAYSALAASIVASDFITGGRPATLYFSRRVAFPGVMGIFFGAELATIVLLFRGGLVLRVALAVTAVLLTAILIPWLWVRTNWGQLHFSHETLAFTYLCLMHPTGVVLVLLLTRSKRNRRARAFPVMPAPPTSLSSR